MRKIQNADREKSQIRNKSNMNEAHELTSLFGSILSAGNSSIVSNFELWISDLFRISVHRMPPGRLPQKVVGKIVMDEAPRVHYRLPARPDRSRCHDRGGPGRSGRGGQAHGAPVRHHHPAANGLDFRHTWNPPPVEYADARDRNFAGGGVAIADFDGDGRADIFL